jgi:hypothetical protein
MRIVVSVAKRPTERLALAQLIATSNLADRTPRNHQAGPNAASVHSRIGGRSRLDRKRSHNKVATRTPITSAKTKRKNQTLINRRKAEQTAVLSAVS